MAYQRGSGGSGFVGLQQYLNANRGAAQQMGGDLAAGLNKSAADVQNEIDVGASAFGAAAQAGTPQFDQTTAMLEGGVLGEQARNGGIQYRGPNTLRDVVDTDYLKNRVTSVGQQAELAGTDAGRATLLQQRYGQGYTGVGGRSLDAWLAGVGGGEGIAKATTGISKLQSYLGTAETNAAAKAAQGKGAAAALSDTYQSQFPRSTAPYTIGQEATSAGGATANPAPRGIGFNSGAQTAAGRTLNITTGLPITNILGTFGIGKKRR